MTVVLAERRARVARQQVAERNAQLRDAAGELRAAAEPYMEAGRYDLAAPYLEEAAMFEDAQRAG